MLCDFEIHLDHLISSRRLDLRIVYKKEKKTYRIVDFAVTAYHRLKLKKKRDKYQDITRGLKKLWNMKVTVIPIVIRSLNTVTK